MNRVQNIRTTRQTLAMSLIYPVVVLAAMAGLVVLMTAPAMLFHWVTQ